MPKNAFSFDAIFRILVIKLRHHGDVLLTSPVFSVLKHYAPHVTIDALVYADTAPMLEDHPAIFHIHVIDKKWKKEGFWAYAAAEYRLLKALKAARYDLVIHLTDHPRGAWTARLSGAPFAITYKTKGRGAWWEKSFTHFVVSPSSLRHTVERHLDALRYLGIFPKEDERRLCLVPGKKAEERISKLLASCAPLDDGQPFIHIHPASRWLFKCWSVHKMAELISRLQDAGHRIVITCASEKKEQMMIEAILEKLTQPVIAFVGTLSLKELSALIQKASLFIGVDSAPMHMASALGTPVVALFGPSAEKEWGPWMIRSCIIASEDHPCRPCGIDGCGGSKVSDCLESLPVSRVFLAAQRLLSDDSLQF